MADRKSWGTALLNVDLKESSTRQIVTAGRDRWALECLIAAGDKGCTPIDVSAPNSTRHETSDHYACVVMSLCPRHRVIVCKDNLQWIVQRCKRVGAERPWRSLQYFRTREALMRLCARVCQRIDPAALAALPDIIGGSA